MSAGIGMRCWGSGVSAVVPSRPFVYPLPRCLTTICSVSEGIGKKDKKDKIIVISGPTGSGKSRISLELAKRLNGEIISADSVQVYRGLDVGSAKPLCSEREEVPHHLIDILNPSEEYSVGNFYEDSRRATQHILQNGRVPIVAGGTGLYLRWYIYGKPDVPKSSPEIASEVCSQLMLLQRNGDWEAAVQLVEQAGDPKARLLPCNDWYRLKRSLEIIKATGSPPSAFSIPYNSFKEQTNSMPGRCDDNIPSPDREEVDQRLSKDLDYNFICFFLSSKRVDLYRMIDLRCEEMLTETDGLLSEALHLLEMGLMPNMNSATRAIGYRQAMEYLLKCKQQGGSTPGDFAYFLSEFQKASRNFAKRQLTWFRNERIYHWLDASQPLDKVLNFILDAYHQGQSDNLVVPESLGISRESNGRESYKLKAYRTTNRYFVRREDCAPVMDWIRRITQVKPEKLIC